MLNKAQAAMVAEYYPILRPYTDFLVMDDVKFVMQYLSSFSFGLQKLIMRKYFSYHERFERNTFLRNLVTDIQAKLPKSAKAVDVSSEHISYMVDTLIQGVSRIDTHIRRRERRENRAKTPYTYSGSIHTDQILYTELSSYMEQLNIEPPRPDTKITQAACIRRMLNYGYLRRRLRKIMSQLTAHVETLIGDVSKYRSIYAGRETVKAYQRNQEAALHYLKSNMLTNGSEVISLYDAHMSSVANPINRRNELMTRIAGTESIANERGDKGLFITITCPSKYHNTHARSGMRNDKWNGAMPKDGQAYLNTLWQRARAELHRRSIQVYGFRVVEPQHDGTPHWHMLLFVSPNQADELCEVIREYALQEDSNERGAKENRCDIKPIDKSRGSAAGYIAKYIAKNIDGMGLEAGVYGECPNVAALHVAAWASTWGVRQFQALGQPSVTVYREARRWREALPESSPFEPIRQAADMGDWAAYTHLMGGVGVGHAKRPVKPLYDTPVDTETGQLSVTKFDQELVKRLTGITNGHSNLITRLHNWARVSSHEAV